MNSAYVKQAKQTDIIRSENDTANPQLRVK